MSKIANLLELPLLRSIYRWFAVGLVLYFLLDIAFVALHFDLMADPEAPTEYANGIALGIGALIALTIGRQHKMRSLARVFWYLIAASVLVLAANELFDLPARINNAWADDEYFDLFILAVTPIGLYLACSIEEAPPLAVRAMITGFVFQCLSDVLDLADDAFEPYVDPRITSLLNDLSELLFIEAYLFGLVCLLLALLARRLVRPEARTGSA
jgi:hypothetical protein